MVLFLQNAKWVINSVLLSQEVLVGLVLTNLAPRLPNLNMKHNKSVEFFRFQNVKPLCTNV